jgi:Carboxypeptidase regulatory-like domain
LSDPLHACLRAQTTSTITGTIRDKQGLVIPGAQVQVTSDSLAIARDATTDADGSYRLTALPPGLYDIKASKSGFGTQVFRDIEVTPIAP